MVSIAHYCVQVAQTRRDKRLLMFMKNFKLTMAAQGVRHARPNASNVMKPNPNVSNVPNVESNVEAIERITNGRTSRVTSRP